MSPWGFPPNTGFFLRFGRVTSLKPTRRCGKGFEADPAPPLCSPPTPICDPPGAPTPAPRGGGPPCLLPGRGHVPTGWPNQTPDGHRTPSARNTNCTHTLCQGNLTQACTSTTCTLHQPRSTLGALAERGCAGEPLHCPRSAHRNTGNLALIYNLSSLPLPSTLIYFILLLRARCGEKAPEGSCESEVSGSSAASKPH